MVLTVLAGLPDETMISDPATRGFHPPLLKRSIMSFELWYFCELRALSLVIMILIFCPYQVQVANPMLNHENLRFRQ